MDGKRITAPLVGASVGAYAGIIASAFLFPMLTKAKSVTVEDWFHFQTAVVLVSILLGAVVFSRIYGGPTKTGRS